LKRGGTEKGSAAGGRKCRFKPVEGSHRMKTWGHQPREVMTWPYGLKCVIPCFQENPRVEPARCPYRKPTQVGEEKILRRLRELWLRNSAYCLRNFGRRRARTGVGTCSRSWLGSQIIGGSDCLPKTQDSANTSSGCIGSDACPVPEG
jgi:hypothetical protein